LALLFLVKFIVFENSKFKLIFPKFQIKRIVLDHKTNLITSIVNQGCESGSWKRLNFCGSGSTLNKEAGSGNKLRSI